MIILMIFCFILAIIGSISFALFMKYKKFYINVCKIVYDNKIYNTHKIIEIRNFIRDLI